MMNKLKQMWKQAAASPQEKKKHDVSLAVAALMVEVMRMDGHLESTERSEIILDCGDGLLTRTIHEYPRGYSLAAQFT